MTTNSAGPTGSIRMNTGNGTLKRQTSNKSFTDSLKNAGGNIANRLGGVMGTAARSVPGSAVASNVLNGIGSALGANGAGPAAAANSGPSQMMASAREMQDNAMKNNFAMLGIQRRFQNDQLAVNIQSNLSKVEYDTKSKIINNVK